MTNIAFLDLINLISQYSYHIVFIAMLVEGPVVTMTASFAAGLGVFNILIIFVLSIFGDLFADFAYYFIGFIGRSKILDKHGHHFGLSPKRITKLESHMHKHYWRTLIAIKLTPFISTPGLIVSGAAKIPFKKFLTVVLAITIPKSILYTVIGYTFGKANTIAIKYFKLGQYGLFIGFLIIIIISFVYERISPFIARKFEKL
ncbi:MAG: hypothetical protein UT61_C0012G0004 [Candidatus Woesebacteria bacterium GW2011_GWA1_39_8]|jgi:membrane protein DedA with SNARE-associated domain|uniref:VTT domain-containing protein n=1 Tax=Candidatus Woesebacteria bacterium GW2011_GWA1_39_8 TaxID=1618552 RepID=A0A0G0PPR3_9BACT|nr:MAG: hypothetical protein UT61_C0012G0004 [Candidatus Woesebacteria bacterium GW2011_GWA1_39_8]